MKERRARLGLSQAGLARRLSDLGLAVKKSAVSKWETGQTPLPLQTARNRRAFAHALHLSIFELLVLAGYEIDPGLSPAARMVAVTYERLSPPQQEAVVGMIEYFLDQLEADTQMSGSSASASA
jgi:transcriptional regulator with XRE-family HTH domain